MVISIFISNGTAARPDAGLLIGDGFSWDAISCTKGTNCTGGRGGFLYGNGGNGWGGKVVEDQKVISYGNGGSAGLLGNGGNADPSLRPVTALSGAGGNGGNGGLLFGNGGNGGAAGTGLDGGNGGNGGLFFGAGGRGGTGGEGAVSCSASDNLCTVTTPAGAGGRGGNGALFMGRAGNGFQALPLNSLNFAGYTPFYPTYPGEVAGYFPDTKTGIKPDGFADKDASPVTAPTGGFPNPYYVEGTVVVLPTENPLPKGMALARWGYPVGGGSTGAKYFLAPDNSNFALLALPPAYQLRPYFEYVVKDPAQLPKGWTIQQSQAAPGFGVYGGGIQFVPFDQNGVPGELQTLVDVGYLAYKN